MTPEPKVQPLPRAQRKYLFVGLFLIFVVLLPVIMFYATGYRFDFTNEESSIVSTGGMYVSAQAEDVDMFLNEEPVRNLRIFRNAAYIQNLSAGVHRLTVQGEGLHTWTKDLPVYPHIVTEVEAFNMPRVPQIRLITPYVTDANESVVFVATTSEEVLPNASTTVPVFLATTSATTTFDRNPEHDFVVSLFGTSSATTTLVERVVRGMNDPFNFATSRGITSTGTATTTRVRDNVALLLQGGEVYARWVGDMDSIPYYYCVDHVSASTTIERYGEHVYEAVKPILADPAEEQLREQNERLRVCRTEIRIDRKRQLVRGFNLLPGSNDHVLMLLPDGLYVVEVDDRSWQNTQLLYPGEGLRFVVEGGQIYVFDGTYYFEVLTTLQQ